VIDIDDLTIIERARFDVDHAESLDDLRAALMRFFDNIACGSGPGVHWPQPKSPTHQEET
jgi:hypothetical protein